MYFLLSLKILFLLLPICLIAEEKTSSWHHFDEVANKERWVLSPGYEVDAEYDLSGNRISWKDWEGAIQYKYDNRNHLACVITADGEETLYKYDVKGNLLQIRYPSNQLVNYTYEPGGFLKTVSFQGLVVTYAYDKRSNLLSKKSTSTGISTEYCYDTARRVKDIIHTHDKKGLIAHFHFKYDAMDNCIFMEKTTPFTKKSAVYEYDRLYRLVKVIYSDGIFEVYTYDPMGNRLTKETNVGVITYAYDEKGLLSQVGDTIYKYNDSGYLIQKDTPKGSMYYVYNILGQLENYHDTTCCVDFSYNGQGERLTKTVEGITSTYSYDAVFPVFQVLEEKKENQERRYIYGRSVLGYMEGDNFFYYLEESPGNPVGVIVDEEGIVVEDLEYDAFGRCLTSSKSSVQYNGEQVDVETGLVFLRTRYYDPEIGRFISPDVLQGTLYNPQTLNRYAYVANNPLKFQDPMGTRAETKKDAIQPSLWAKGVPILLEGDPLPPEGSALLVICARKEGITQNNPTKSDLYRDGREYAGHAWIEIYDSKGEGNSYSTHDAEDSDKKWLCSNDIKVYQHDGHTIRVAYVVPDSAVETAVQNIMEYTKDPYHLFTHNCVLATKEGASAAGIEEVFHTLVPNHLEAEETFMYRPAITPSAIYRRLEGMVDKHLEETNSIKRSPEQLENMEKEKIWVSICSDDAPIPVYNQKISRLENDYVPSKPFESSHETPKRGTFGGICLSKKAEIKLNLKEIHGVIFDETTQQLILIGERDLRLPEMRLDDLTVAVQSIYGLRGPAEDPGISLEPEGESMIAKYRGATYRTEFGKVLFDGDYALKMLFLGKYPCRVPGFLSFSARSVRNRRSYLSKNPNSSSAFRTWIEPEEILLGTSSDGSSMQFDKVKMQCLVENTENGVNFDCKEHREFGKFFTDNYDAIAEEYPIFQEVKRLGQITGVVKWIKESKLPFDLSFFTSYSATACETPLSIPIEHFSSPWLDKRKTKKPPLQLKGGILFQLNSKNFFLQGNRFVDGLKEDVLALRPSETTFSWGIGQNMVAEAFPLFKTRKVGNFQQAFVDLECPVPGEFPLRLTRLYDSFNEEDIGLGVGWSLVPFTLTLTEKVDLTSGNTQLKAPFTLITKEEGVEWLYKVNNYDLAGNLQYVREDGKQSLTLTPNNTYLLLLKNGNQVLFDDKGVLKQTIDKLGQTIAYHYRDGKLTSIEHRQGEKITIHYDGDRVVLALDPLGNQIQFAFYNRQLAAITNQFQEKMQYYLYDGNKRLSGILSGKGAPLFVGKYDEYNRLISASVGKRTVEKSYNLKEKSSILKIGNRAPIEKRYDSNYCLLDQKKAGEDLWASPEAIAPEELKLEEGWRYTYNKQWLIKEAVNQKGNTWTFLYNKQKDLVFMEDPQGNKTGFAYDELHRITTILRRMQTCSSDSNGGIFMPSGMNILTFIETTQGVIPCCCLQEDKSSIQYNHIKKIEQITVGGESTLFTYDENGALKAIQFPSGYTIKRELDEYSRTKRIFDEKGEIISFVFKDLVKEEHSPQGILQYHYNAEGLLQKVIDRLENKTEFFYLGSQLCEVKDAEGNIFKVYF